jgi:hypothetical protein
MYSEAVKIPNNQQSRLSQDVWIAGEAIARHRRMASSRDAFETAVRDYANRLAENDQSFKKVWEDVAAEWEFDNSKAEAQEPSGTGKRSGAGRPKATPEGETDGNS